MDISKETLLREAAADYDAGKLSEPQREAVLCLRAIQLGKQYRVQCRVAQGQLVAQAAREKLYAKHPRQFPTLWEYLKAAGLGESTVSDLVMVGKLVEFCDKHHIKVDQYLDDRQWPKLREALPALRCKVAVQDPKGARAILKDVKRLPTREAVRAKYRRSRPKLGRGVTIQAAGGQMALVAVPENGWGEDELAATLGRALHRNGRKNGLGSQLVNVLAEAIRPPRMKSRHRGAQVPGSLPLMQ